MNIKRCSKCGIEQSVSKFCKDRSCKDKLYPQCKQCVKKYQIEYYQQNKERIKEYNRRYNQRNKERIKECRRRYYQQNKEYYKAYCQKNREKRRKYYQKYNQQNKERIDEYRQKNKERIKKRVRIRRKKPEIMNKRNEHNRLARQNDPKLRLIQKMSSSICMSLKGNKNGRHWENLVGYTLKDLRIHLENLFYTDKNINWNNYGSYWHIDHIKPISLFNFIKPENKEFKKCWALNNLQPLEASKNIGKGNRFKLPIS